VRVNQADKESEEENATAWSEDDESDDSVESQDNSMEGLKMDLLVQASTGASLSKSGPPSGLTAAVPRFQSDLEDIVCLTQSKTPVLRPVRESSWVLTAFYGFGDASSAGFGASVERPNGLHTRHGLWPRDAEDQSSNYRELKNLVDMVEEESNAGYLQGSELWLFTDNSTAESCFHKGGSSSRHLHDLVLRLRKLELDARFTLFVVHVAGTRMIAQGTDGLS